MWAEQARSRAPVAQHPWGPLPWDLWGPRDHADTLILVSRHLHRPQACEKARARVSARRPPSLGSPRGWSFEDVWPAAANNTHPSLWWCSRD